MRFLDPMPVTCPTCAAESAQRVADLLALQATCPRCSTEMNDIGLRMRASMDDWSAFCAWARISMEVEDRLGVSMDDGAVLKAKLQSASLTLGDLADLVRRYLPSEVRSKEIVLEAARTLWGKDVGAAALELPILEAMHPTRWNTDL
jgi:hypothetical protein